ncbi:MAG TPA: hypothetical protein VH234_05135 [Candidatus Saccharimonadales bacterium]|jgi:hypothetical protein|nr:hypothetical protein [Candidatus Saccharimonadales bacterium]
MAAKKSSKTSKKAFLNQKRTYTNAQVLVFVLIFALVGIWAILQSSAAPSAGKGGHTNGGTISAPQLVTDNNSNGIINYGDWVTFTISTTATTTPYVALQCFQNGALVLNGRDGYFDGAIGNRTFGLSSPTWTSGAANCTANLITPPSSNGKYTILATTSFQVYP